MSKHYLQIECSRAAIKHNIAAIRQRLNENGCPDSKLCAVVKANAYGHGLSGLWPLLADECDMLAVATIAEALELRGYGYGGPLLVTIACSPSVWPGAAGLLAEAMAADIALMAVDIADLAELNSLAAGQGVTAHLHVKVDTGMGRSGVNPAAAAELTAAIASDAYRHLRLAGLCTHFAAADAADKSHANAQLEIFKHVVAACGAGCKCGGSGGCNGCGVGEADDASGIGIAGDAGCTDSAGGSNRCGGDNASGCNDGADSGGIIVHAAASAAAGELAAAGFDMIRVGLSLYGYNTDELLRPLDLRPALRLIAPLVQIKKLPAGVSCGYGCTHVLDRDSVVGIVPAGYADGLTRSLSGKLSVTITGRSAAVLGRISMDQIIVDLTDIPEAAAGAMVEIISADPSAANSAEALAKATGTIAYEITSSLNGHRIDWKWLDEFYEL